MKKKDVIEFFKRGLMFGGFGSIIVGFILFIISMTDSTFSIEGWQIFVAIISGYLLAFVQASTTVFHTIEKWSPVKSVLLQLVCLYVVYVGAYLINNWIPFDYKIILIFTAIFIGSYFVIWLIVYLSIKATSKRLNKLKNEQ